LFHTCKNVVKIQATSEDFFSVTCYKTSAVPDVEAMLNVCMACYWKTLKICIIPIPMPADISAEVQIICHYPIGK